MCSFGSCCSLQVLNQPGVRSGASSSSTTATSMTQAEKATLSLLLVEAYARAGRSKEASKLLKVLPPDDCGFFFFFSEKEYWSTGSRKMIMMTALTDYFCSFFFFSCFFGVWLCPQMAEKEFTGTNEELRVTITKCNFAIRKGDAEKAMEQLSSIPQDSPQYLRAKMALADVHLKQRRVLPHRIGCAAK